jgi:hypothetical protein
MQFIASFFCKMNLIITSLAFLIFVSCSSSDPRIAEFVDSELDLYPEARLTDIYKSFF